MYPVIVRSVMSLALVTLAACAHQPLQHGRISQDAIMARDLVRAVIQLDEQTPESTMVRFDVKALEAQPFLRSIRSAMASRGYAIHEAAARPGDDRAGSQDKRRKADGSKQASEALVQHESTKYDYGNRVTHTLSVGSLQVRRSYERDAVGDWAPAGAFLIRGADAGQLQLNEQSFAAEPGSSISVAATQSSSTIEDWTPRNIMELGDSNFASAFNGFADVQELVLIFPNDSLRLGDAERARIRQSVDSFDAARDVYSIVGCSVGATALDNGNEALALGRAGRVREELLMAGVSSRQILDEGCWAGQSQGTASSYPSRGVVLTLKRKQG